MLTAAALLRAVLNRVVRLQLSLSAFVLFDLAAAMELLSPWN